MTKVPNAVEILPKIWTAWVGRTSVTDRRQADRQTDGRQQIANVNVSSRSLIKTDARNERSATVIVVSQQSDNDWCVIVWELFSHSLWSTAMSCNMADDLVQFSISHVTPLLHRGIFDFFFNSRTIYLLSLYLVKVTLLTSSLRQPLGASDSAMLLSFAIRTRNMGQCPTWWSPCRT